MLPNLPQLIGQWETSLQLVPTAVGQWVPLTVGDPCRWFMSVDDPQGGQPLLWNEPGSTGLDGLIIPFGSFREFKYQDYGPLVGSQWYVLCRVGNPPVTLYTAAIRLRSDFLFSDTDRQDKILSEVRSLRRFIKDIIRRTASAETGA